MKWTIFDLFAIGSVTLLIMVGIAGLVDRKEPVTMRVPCEVSTIIETKTQECLVIPIPGSRPYDGIPDQKLYCRDLNGTEE